MFWKISTLAPELQDGLATVSREKGIAGVPCYFRSKHRLGLLVVLLVIAGAAAVGGLFTALDAARDWLLIAVLVFGVLTALAALWSLALLLELARGATAEIRPFLLLTPAVLLRCEYGHGFLEAHRLKDATDFKTVNQYGSNQKSTGREFVFTFDGRPVSFTVKNGPDIARVDEIVAHAKAKVRSPVDGTALVPADEGSKKIAALRNVSDPFGAFWLGVLALLIVLAFLGFILAKILD